MPSEYAFQAAKDTLKFVADTSSINIRFWEPLISFLAIEEPPAGDIKILSLSVLGEAMLDDGIVDVLLQQTMMLDVIFNLIKINRENSRLLCESYFNLGEIAAGAESQVATLSHKSHKPNGRQLERRPTEGTNGNHLGICWCHCQIPHSGKFEPDFGLWCS